MEPITWRCGNVLSLSFSADTAAPEQTLLDVKTINDGDGFSIELPEDHLEALAEAVELARLAGRHRARTQAITW